MVRKEKYAERVETDIAHKASVKEKGRASASQGK